MEPENELITREEIWEYLKDKGVDMCYVDLPQDVYDAEETKYEVKQALSFHESKTNPYGSFVPESVIRAEEFAAREKAVLQRSSIESGVARVRKPAKKGLPKPTHTSIPRVSYVPVQKSQGSFSKMIMVVLLILLILVGPAAVISGWPILALIAIPACLIWKSKNRKL